MVHSYQIGKWHLTVESHSYTNCSYEAASWDYVVLNSLITQYHAYQKYAGNMPKAPGLGTPPCKGWFSIVKGFHSIALAYVQCALCFVHYSSTV